MLSTTSSLIIATPIALALGLPAALALKTLALRRYYTRQGIKFTTTYPLFGSEFDITRLISRNKTRDYLYVNERAPETDFVGSIRGLGVQLYSVSRAATDELVKPNRLGNDIDRNTPALYSFGQLSPAALTFTPIQTERFHERKANILRSFDKDRMDRVSREFSSRSVAASDLRKVTDVKALVSDWTRQVMGEFVWGENAARSPISYKTSSGEKKVVPFVYSLNETFTRLRFYSNRFWCRVYFPVAAWPITREARLLRYNIRALHAHLQTIMPLGFPAETVADVVSRGNASDGVLPAVTRDDLLTVSIAGLDTVQSMVLATIWQLYQPANQRWLDAISSATGDEREELVEACIDEAIRVDPPGSVINNITIRDFQLHVKGRPYSFRRGTRLMPNIHALHASYGEAYDPARFLDSEIKKGLYVMPFGRGRRSCPGQVIGMMMAKNFINAFVHEWPNAEVINSDDSYMRFNNLSKSRLIMTAPTRGSATKMPSSEMLAH